MEDIVVGNVELLCICKNTQHGVPLTCLLVLPMEVENAGRKD